MSTKEQKERENFLLHSILIVDYTRDGLADLIEVDVVEKKSSFEDFINNNQHDIYHLCYNRGRCCQCKPGYILPQNRILHPSQLELLFDKHGSHLPCHNTGRRAEFCCCRAKPCITTSVLDVTLARCLLTNFCTSVFWNSCLPNGETLEDFLNRNKHDLYHSLVGNDPCCMCFPGYVFPVKTKSINQNDWNLLFGAKHSPCKIHTKPRIGAPDICSVSATTGIFVNQLHSKLSLFLLEKFCSLRQAVETLVQIRNSVYAHAKDTKISDDEFRELRLKTETALLEVAVASSKKPEIRKKINDLKKQCLDEALLNQYQVKILEQIQMESDVKEVIYY